jgi:hypothetical protein
MSKKQEIKKLQERAIGLAIMNGRLAGQAAAQAEAAEAARQAAAAAAAPPPPAPAPPPPAPSVMDQAKSIQNPYARAIFLRAHQTEVFRELQPNAEKVGRNEY